jgi:hypothetical protein
MVLYAHVHESIESTCTTTYQAWQLFGGWLKDIRQYIIASLSSFEMNLELEVIY